MIGDDAGVKRAGVALLAPLAILAAACRTEPPPAPAPREAASASARPPSERPVRFVHAPKAPAGPTPLVLVLHGYGGDARDADGYFELGAMAEREGLVVVVPDGTIDSTGSRFWNAVDGCCDFEKRGVDDVAYLVGLVDDAAKRFPIDPARVYAVGLSNGGAMAMRLACDASERFAAVVSVAGPFYADPERCKPAVPVAVRHVHGTSDRIVPFAGGLPPPGLHPNARVRFPGAEDVTAAWARRNGCGKPAPAGPAFDFDAAVAGAETTATRWEGCARGADVELWRMEGSAHVPRPLRFGETTLTFLRAHARK